MSLEIQFHNANGRVEASAELHFYGAHGYYKVNILGFGSSKARATEHAEDMAMRARTALQLATIEDSSRRVPEASENVRA